MLMPSLSAIDLFSGAGGLSAGFEQAGFRIVAANDLDEHAAATFQLNHPGVPFLHGPIGGIGADELLRTTGLRRGELDALLGGPPCQGFSVYNHQRGMHDERSGLFREYLRMVDGLMPRFVVIENVTGITSVGGGSAPAEIKTRLSELGYHVEARVLKAEEFGVPQERRRIFFLGARDQCSIPWPEQTHGETSDSLATGCRLKPFVGVSDAFGDLPPLKIGEGAEEMAYTSEPQSGYQALLRVDSDRVYNHIAPRLASVNVERMKYIPQGGSWRDLPHSLLPTGMKRARRSDHTKRYGRMHPDGQSCTILTKCDLHWGAYIHPDQDRTISVREAARLQSFQDTFRFLGSRGEQYKQVGNAVPPLLARAVAKAMIATEQAQHHERRIASTA